MTSLYNRFPSPSGQTFDTGAGATTGNTLRTVIVTDQTPIPVTISGGALDFGASAAAQRVAALLGNSTGAADFGSGAAGAQTLRAVISTRSETAATPLSSRLSDGAAFYTAATTAQFPATLGQKLMAGSFGVVIASDQSTVPVSLAGTALDFGASAAALRVASLLGNATGAADFDTGASTAQTLRTVISTRSETAGTPLAARLSDGAAFYNAPASSQLPAALGQQAMVASLSVAIASDQSSVPVTETQTDVAYTAVGQVAFGSVTNAYTTVLSITATTKILYVFNSLDQSVNLSLDGGVSDAFVLEAGDGFSMDLGTDGLKLSNGVDIQVKYTGAAPTSGKIRVTAIG